MGPNQGYDCEVLDYGIALPFIYLFFLFCRPYCDFVCIYITVSYCYRCMNELVFFFLIKPFSVCAGTEGSISEQLSLPRVVVLDFPVSWVERAGRRPSQLPHPFLVAIDTVGHGEVQQDRLWLTVTAQLKERDSQRLALSASSCDKQSQPLKSWAMRSTGPSDRPNIVQSISFHTHHRHSLHILALMHYGVRGVRYNGPERIMNAFSS